MDLGRFPERIGVRTRHHHSSLSLYGMFHMSHDACVGLPVGQLELSFGSTEDPLDGMLADSYSVADILPTWSFEATTGNDPFTSRAEPETNPNANKSASLDSMAMLETSDSGRKSSSLKACPNSGCPFRAKTKRDVARHHLAVHEKTALFFCEHPGCTRRRGWSRKDSRDRHVNTVHGRQRDSPLHSVARINTVLSPRSEYAGQESPEPTEPAGAPAESLSKEEALRQLYEERRMRLDVENQLQELRKRYEERDCMLLKFLASKVNLGQE
ncbi:hypothetical protein NCS52_00781700 [Fusarium sp. LHS14.1]|nr:hypothetical protein NCS52_00781700 [Fusarium sp. LHS14.1]